MDCNLYYIKSVVIRLILDNALLNFNIHSQSTVVPTDDSLSYLDVKSCASACLTQNAFQCEGFSYCQDQYMCVMSKTHPDLLDSKDIHNKTNCTTYNSNADVYFLLNIAILVFNKAVHFTIDLYVLNLYFIALKLRCIRAYQCAR